MNNISYRNQATQTIINKFSGQSLNINLLTNASISFSSVYTGFSTYVLTDASIDPTLFSHITVTHHAHIFWGATTTVERTAYSVYSLCDASTGEEIIQKSVGYACHTNPQKQSVTFSLEDVDNTCILKVTHYYESLTVDCASSVSVDNISVLIK